MYKNIKAVLFDVDGVITDGKKYLYGNREIKSVSLKDLDAVHMLKSENYFLGAVTGEDTDFLRSLKEEMKLDAFVSGCKEKSAAVKKLADQFHLDMREICYIGDGKYDLEVLKEVGLSICPADAIQEVKVVADFVLERTGGNGCIAEAYSLLHGFMGDSAKSSLYAEKIVRERMQEHERVLQEILKSKDYLRKLALISSQIVRCYKNGGKLLLCGNGGSASDAQHLAGELVSRFYMERKAMPAEALNANTSIITAIANDYSFNRIFAREIEAKGKREDVLIGISTSGRSENVLEALKTAKGKGMTTVLFTGAAEEKTETLQYADYVLKVPSRDTPRIQEIHILSGHIMCEIVEKEIADWEENKG